MNRATYVLQQFFVKKIYADHNDTAAVKNALESVFKGFPTGGKGLNIGAGYTSFGPDILNMEMEDGPGIDITGSALELPMEDETLDLVISQEVLEHLPDPLLAVQEIHRVLRPGGKAYIQIPFMIGYHPCPDDYWRFTTSGLKQLAERAGLNVIQTGITVGAGTGFYRIAVEFFATLFSIPLHRLYRPLKAGFSLLLYPIKWLDGIMRFSPEAHRIAGGFYVILQK